MDTVDGTLTLTSGALGLSSGDGLTMANGSTISRSAGSISGVAPTIGSGHAINVMYTNSSALTTGLELPSGSSSLNNLRSAVRGP